MQFSSYPINLQTALNNFESLLHIEYIYTIANKKTVDGTKSLTLSFNRECFYHLLGLQHLKLNLNKNQLPSKSKKADFYKLIKNEKLTVSNLILKPNDIDAVKRIYYFTQLESLLDKNKDIYKFDNEIIFKNTYYNSKIDANFLLKNVIPVANDKEDLIFCFLKSDIGNEKLLSPISFFSSNIDYSRGQKHETLLIKKKNHNKGGVIETLFIHPSYLKNHKELLETEKEYISAHPELIRNMEKG